MFDSSFHKWMYDYIEKESFDKAIKSLELSPKEIPIVKALLKGASNKTIAKECKLKPKTVKFHLTQILAKLKKRTKAKIPLRRDHLLVYMFVSDDYEKGL